MSIDSNYTNRMDITLKQNKTLQGTLSHGDSIPVSRRSIKSPTKEHHDQEQSKSRNRTLSVSDNPTTTSPTVTELISSTNKKDRRFSELKRPVDQHENTSVDRRYSTPQLHLGSLFSHSFFNQKHHHKTQAKEEINPNPINTNASSVISSNQFVDSMATKTDTFYIIKPPMNGTRLIPATSSERLFSTSTEDSTIGSSTFIFEENLFEPRSAEMIIIESHTPICVAEIYRDLFYDYFHINYYGEFDYEGPFLASLRCSNHRTVLGEICEARVIIRTQYRNCHLSDIVNGNNENNILQILLNKLNFSPIHSYGTIGDPKANEKLYLFDKNNDERFNCKIGMIYQQQNQTSEYEIYSNDYLSNEMTDFLQSLAQRIRLKTFPKYKGDLDTREDLHGEYSYYTVHDNHEIMFNIAPLIPSTKANGQCIERKGLVGNAFVCVVFQDYGAIFTPDLISGKVTQIYITVQPVTIENDLYYKVGIWRRNDITTVIDPPGGMYKNDNSFPLFFLTLLLNAVNTAIESPSLRTRIFKPRQQIKLEEIKKLVQYFSLGPLPAFFLEADHPAFETRPYVRNESTSTSISSITTNESVNSNTAIGRASPGTSKKRGFSKLFNVFSSRSTSISSPSGTNNDPSSTNPQTPATASEVIPSLFRGTTQPTKDNRTRSIKSTQAPIPPSRPMNSHVPQAINIHPPTPSVITLNPLNSENIIQTNLLHTNNIDIMPRNRSNSSPEDIVYSKQTRHVSTINEEDQRADNSDTTDTEEEEEETSTSSSSSISSENVRPSMNRSYKSS